MAERLKRRWFKFIAVFCSLYMAPLSTLFTKVFAFIKPAEALAVTAYCYPDSSTHADPDTYMDRADVLDCKGNYSLDAIDETGDINWYAGMSSSTLTCVCSTSVSRVTTYKCQQDSADSEYGQWVVVDSCVTPTTTVTCASDEVEVAGACYPACIESPENAVGYVATAPVF